MPDADQGRVRARPLDNNPLGRNAIPRGAKERTGKSKARIDNAGRLMRELSDLETRTAKGVTQIDSTGTDRRTTCPLSIENLGQTLSFRFRPARPPHVEPLRRRAGVVCRAAFTAAPRPEGATLSGDHSRLPLADCPAIRNVLGNFPVPQSLKVPKSLYQSPSGTSGSCAFHSASSNRSSCETLRSLARSRRWAHFSLGSRSH